MVLWVLALLALIVLLVHRPDVAGRGLLFLAAFIAVAKLGGRWLSRREREVLYRLDNGLCRHCGYDLRATPAGRGELLDRCPECGRFR